MPSIPIEFDQSPTPPVQPVEIVTCWACHGSGRIDMVNDTDRRCCSCGGTGQIATLGGER